MRDPRAIAHEIIPHYFCGLDHCQACDDIVRGIEMDRDTRATGTPATQGSASEWRPCFTCGEMVQVPVVEAEDDGAALVAACGPCRRKEVVKRLGIDVPKWAAETRAKVEAATTATPGAPAAVEHCRREIGVCRGVSYCACQCDQCYEAHFGSPRAVPVERPTCASWCGERYDKHEHPAGDVPYQDMPRELHRTRCYCSPECRHNGAPLNPSTQTPCARCGGTGAYSEEFIVADCPDCRGEGRTPGDAK